MTENHENLLIKQAKTAACIMFISFLKTKNLHHTSKVKTEIDSKDVKKVVYI